MNQSKTSKKSFPLVSHISFFKLFDLLEEMKKGSDNSKASFATQLLKELEPYPELKTGLKDHESLKNYKSQIEKLSSLVFSEILKENEIKGIAAPFELNPIVSSERLQRILDNAGKDFELELVQIDDNFLYQVACTMILQRIYNYPSDISRPFTVEIPNKKEEKTHYYRVAFNTDLIEIVPTESAPKITEDDYIKLINNFDNIAYWKEKFPPASYIMKGIGVLNMMDVTFDQNVSMVTANLLNQNLESFEKIKKNIQAIMDISDLMVGFVGFDSGDFYANSRAEVSSIILRDQANVSSEDLLCTVSKEVLLHKKQPMIISDTHTYQKIAGSLMGRNLIDQQIMSYIIVPLYDSIENEILAFIELASPRKHELNGITIAKLDSIIPTFTIAAKRHKEEDKNRTEALIQQECTTIHDSVKWLFEEEAARYMASEGNGERAQFNDILLRDVYPLYGQMDIKGSSDKRNKAVISDLINQLNAVKEILDEVVRLKPMPMFDELTFRINTHIKDLHDGLMAGSEHEIMKFLEKEVYPAFDHIEQLSDKLNQMTKDYKSSLDDNLGILYKERRKFDESVRISNHMMASFVDKKQKEAQKMFPHYFERYKTDGLEYNIYIGQSIVKDKKFNPLFLSNLRLWQLTMMCQLENEFKLLQDDLKTDLEVASLILVFNAPLSIHFRMDEKRFDVEGAYNARYEIVKKRVDKAHIKGTNDRITVPGKIAIIYTSDQDKLEYLKYIEYIESKGYLKPHSTEDLLLEDLQGITGLKALRVTLSYSDEIAEESEHHLTYDELIKTLEE